MFLETSLFFLIDAKQWWTNELWAINIPQLMFLNVWNGFTFFFVSMKRRSFKSDQLQQISSFGYLLTEKKIVNKLELLQNKILPWTWLGKGIRKRQVSSLKSLVCVQMLWLFVQRHEHLTNLKEINMHLLGPIYPIDEFLVCILYW